MSTTLKILLLFLILPQLIGCSNLLYLSRLGWHQSFVTFRSVPVQEVLEEGGLEEESRQKIDLIQTVKRFGEERLGLKRTENYTKYFDTDRPVLYLLTASEKDRLRLYHWDFPIIGRVTYKSIFTLKEAKKEKADLERKGLDTYLQQAAAYSTLGWLKDPIFSSMLAWDEPTLVNVILHEMVHGTVYFKGETALNEQLATFIGNRGTLLFLGEKYGSASKEVALAMAYQEDELLFAKWIEEAYRTLSEFYDRPISREEKLIEREEVFKSLQEQFIEMQGRFKTGCYKEFERKKLNNAVLMAHRTYLGRMDRFEALYERLGRDLKKVVAFFKEIKSSGDQSALIFLKE